VEDEAKRRSCADKASYKSICSDNCCVALKSPWSSSQAKERREAKQDKTRQDVSLEERRKRQEAKPPKGEADDTKQNVSEAK
jgi:hypothetical protein